MQNDPDASRTIRFCEAIDIREIPHKDCQTQLLQNGINQNPSEESTKTTCSCPKICKTKQNIIIGIVLICVIVGTVSRILLTEEDEIITVNPRIFNETCDDRANRCDRKKGLHCHDNQCECNDFAEYWDDNTQICASRLRYSETCTSNDSCSFTLICSNKSRQCTCDKTTYYHPHISLCVNRGSFGEPCKTSINSTCLLSLYCNGHICDCPIGKNWLASKTICITSE